MESKGLIEGEESEKRVTLIEKMKGEAVRTTWREERNGVGRTTTILLIF